MSELDQYKQLLRNLVKAEIPVQTMWCKVIAATEKYCDVKGLVDDVEIWDVMNGLDIIRIPKVGSKCLVGIVENHEAQGFLLWCEELEEIRIKGMDYTTLKGAEVIAELKKTQAIVDALMNIINGLPVNEPGSGSPSAFQAALKAAAGALPNANYNSNLENKTVKHG